LSVTPEAPECRRWIGKQRIAKTRNGENAKGTGASGHQFDDLSEHVIEAAIAVHRELGPGFLESIFESAMKTALLHRGMAYELPENEVRISRFRPFAISR
jgi:hypothetical protein